MVVLTANRARELHEALRRHCIRDRIACPGPEKESEIVNPRVRDVAKRTARAVAAPDPCAAALAAAVVTGSRVPGPRRRARS